MNAVQCRGTLIPTELSLSTVVISNFSTFFSPPSQQLFLVILSPSNSLFIFHLSRISVANSPLFAGLRNLVKMAEELWRHSNPASTAMWRFIQTVNAKHNLSISDYKGLYRWSIDNVALFWEECWDFVGIKGEVDGKVCMKSIPSDILHLSVTVGAWMEMVGNWYETRNWSRFMTHKKLLASRALRNGSIQRCFQFDISHDIAPPCHFVCSVRCRRSNNLRKF